MIKRVFFGWYIVAAGVILSALVGGVIVYGFTALVNPMVTSLGWTYAEISLAMSLRGVENGILSPFVGKAADRWPPRWLIFAGAIIIGLGYIGLSRVTNLAMYYVTFIIISLGAVLATGMTTTATVVRWFKRDVGKAAGILAMGTALGGVFTPVLVKIIDAFGWRMTLVIMGIVVLIVGTPLSFLFRTRPEDYGMVPDGKAPDHSEAAKRSNIYDFNTGVSQALKMPVFWFLCLINMLQSVAVGAIDIHSMPYLVSLGIARSTASIIAMTFPLVSLPARFGFGWLGDLFKKNYMLGIALFLQSLGLLAFSFARNGSWFLIVVYIICYGISLGGLIPLRAPITREYFGTRNFGTIFGLVTLFSTAGSVAGAPLAGWVYDTRGTYYPIWLIFSAIGLTGALLAFILLPTSKHLIDTAAERKLRA